MMYYGIVLLWILYWIFGFCTGFVVGFPCESGNCSDNVTTTNDLTVEDCEGVCVSGIDLCNICVGQAKEGFTYFEAIGEAYQQGGTLAAVEELSNLVIWSNKFNDPLDGSKYRIDGVFFDGKFISSMTGEEINFRNYPLFDPLSLNPKEGDTLIYDQDWNTFGIDLPIAKYRALISFPKVDTSVKSISTCPTVNRFICSGGGNCVNGECICDNWSKGDACQYVKSCPNDCNGYGTCDEDTGKCFCPGFSGTSCEYCHTGIKEKTVDNGTLFDCFVLSEEPMTFKDAVVYCGNQGIPLAEIQTEQDHTNIIEKLQDLASDLKKDVIFGWLGATNMDDPGVMTWIMGDGPVNTDEQLIINDANYEHWKNGEPRGIDSDDNDDCLSIKSDTKQWHDTSCDRKNSYAICQFRELKRD